MHWQPFTYIVACHVYIYMANSLPNQVLDAEIVDDKYPTSSIRRMDLWAVSKHKLFDSMERGQQISSVVN